MKFSLTWLKDHLDTQAPVAEIAAALNAIGLEVEGIEDPAARLAGFRVARVLTAAPHPNADKLQVLTVDTGEGDPLQVVCGAPNARAGLVGVLGLPGATVPANGMVLKVAAVRGVESNGMMCSTRELELGEDHDGIIELPADAPVGTPFAQYHGADPVFDVAITPNRPDCMGVYGIARDLAAAGLGALRPIAAPAIDGAFPCPVAIRTEDPQGCPAFHGRVIRGVTNGPSPQWLQDRLKSAGQRPISALVDLTNYVMLGYGRPAHAYDLAKLTGAVVARRARDGETCLALNGREYALTPGMTVIEDEAGVHDIAGIMGGEHSGCSETTTDVLLEVAYFDPERIAATGRALNLTSDARSRFERGVDPRFLDTGLELLTRLILETCGGEASAVVRAGEPPRTTAVVAYDPGLAETLGGVAIPAGEQRRMLEALGFSVDADWTVTAPGWRPDVAGAPDIVEEVVRIWGLDNIESVPLPRADGVARPTATPAQKLERRARRAAAGRGLNEAVTWSFLPVSEAEAFSDAPLWVLDNPISEDMKAMRPSLLPGLLAAARRNLARGAGSLRLFEIGRRYLRGADGASDERLTLGVVLAGDRTARGWATGKAQGLDAFDAKAEALALLAEAGAPVENLQVMGPDALGPGPQFHPGQSATLRLGPKTVLARFGMLHPATARAFDLDGPVAVAELFLDAIPAKRGTAGFARAAYAPPALQPVTRDFAFLIAADKPAGDLVRTVKGADKANIVAARLFDDFRGQGVPEGQKSLAIEVTLQPAEKSYAEADLKAIADRVTAAAAKLGAVLRGVGVPNLAAVAATRAPDGLVDPSLRSGVTMSEPVLVRIASDRISAAINPLGAELWSLHDAAGREYMTDADPTFWSGHAPLLFPVVGALNQGVYRIDGRDYALPKHGFARTSRFDLVDHTPDRARLRLTDSDATRATWPFAFALALEFRAEGDVLRQVATVTNPGDTPLWFSFGFHPAFAWPLPGGAAKGDHRVIFAADEPQPVRRIDPPSGLLLPAPQPSPVTGRELVPEAGLFEADALIWDRLASRSLTFGAAAGARLEIGFPDTPMLGIWQKPGAAYLCLEPWQGIADPQGWTGDLRDKPGVVELAAGAARSFRLDIRVVPAAR